MYLLFPHVCQLTTTANDNSPELVAAVKRGPFACADENELVDYLLSRKKLSRAPVERHGLLHVVSYQRRLAYIKDEFFKRGRMAIQGTTKVVPHSTPRARSGRDGDAIFIHQTRPAPSTGVGPF